MLRLLALAGAFQELHSSLIAVGAKNPKLDPELKELAEALIYVNSKPRAKIMKLKYMINNLESLGYAHDDSVKRLSSELRSKLHAATELGRSLGAPAIEAESVLSTVHDQVTSSFDEAVTKLKQSKDGSELQSLVLIVVVCRHCASLGPAAAPYQERLQKLAWKAYRKLRAVPAFGFVEYARKAEATLKAVAVPQKAEDMAAKMEEVNSRVNKLADEMHASIIRTYNALCPGKAVQWMKAMEAEFQPALVHFEEDVIVKTWQLHKAYSCHTTVTHDITAILKDLATFEDEHAEWLHQQHAQLFVLANNQLPKPFNTIASKPREVEALCVEAIRMAHERGVREEEHQEGNDEDEGEWASGSDAIKQILMQPPQDGDYGFKRPFCDALIRKIGAVTDSADDMHRAALDSEGAISEAQRTIRFTVNILDQLIDDVAAEIKHARALRPTEQADEVPGLAAEIAKQLKEQDELFDKWMAARAHTKALRKLQEAMAAVSAWPWLYNS